MLFLMAFDTGARLSEFLSMTIGDVLAGQRKVLVRDKGGKDRWVFFGRFTAQLLQRYLIAYGQRFGIKPDAPLFVTEYWFPNKASHYSAVDLVQSTETSECPNIAFSWSQTRFC